MNNSLKIKILYDFKDGPWGGANQFLKVLREEFMGLGIYEEEAEKANCIIFYSYQKLPEVLQLKLKYPEKIFVHRLGGVLHYHKGEEWLMIDRVMNKVASKLADLAVFVSRWLYDESTKFGFKGKTYTIIGNAVNKEIFNASGKTDFNPQKIKLIASSWSGNFNKGFSFYKYLDQHLDWSRYEMIFVGNSPIQFKNIKIAKPMASEQLADISRQHDIYVTATKDDACSNAILEALTCGLPVVALKSGGNGEIVQDGGELFASEQEMMEKIELVTKQYERYTANIKFKDARAIANEYVENITKITDGQSKRISKLLEYEVKITFWLFNKRQKLAGIIDRLKLAKRSAYRYYKFSWHRNALENLLLQNVGLLSGRVLDIGSKNRRYDKIIKAEEIVAIDLEENRELNVLYGDIEKGLNYPDANFDSILCLEVVEYLYDFNKAAKEMFRLLKPGRTAIISIPFLRNEHDDNFRPTRKFAEKIFQEAGFSFVEIKTFGNGHTAVWDIMKKKFTKSRSPIERKLAYYFVSLPWLAILRIFKLDKAEDIYYSGLFIILTK